MPSCSTYRLTLVFLTLGVVYLFSAVSAKVQPLLLTLDEGYLLTAALPDLQHGMAPLGPPAPAQPPLLGRGVGPPGHRPWPRVWGGSSQPFLCRHSLALLAAVPDLRLGVALLSCS